MQKFLCCTHSLLLLYKVNLISSYRFRTMALSNYCREGGQRHNVPLNKYCEQCGQQNMNREYSSSAPSPPPPPPPPAAATPRTERAGSSVNPLLIDTSPTPKASKAMYVPSQVNPLSQVELALTTWEARRVHACTELLLAKNNSILNRVYKKNKSMILIKEQKQQKSLSSRSKEKEQLIKIDLSLAVVRYLVPAGGGSQIEYLGHKVFCMSRTMILPLLC
jgi:hypothetical protein